MPENSCLSADQLKSYALGRLDDVQTQWVSRHLKDCLSCEETLSGFDDTNDSFLLQIRTAQPPEGDSPPPLEDALVQIAALHSSSNPTSALKEGVEDWVRDYRLVGKLGQGGMGTVYKAVHERLQRTVALKLLPARRLRNHEAVARFEREMQAIGRLDHPAIVRATDAGEVEGTHFLAMDYVNGIDLSKVVRLTGSLSIPNACEVIRVVATGLSYAHEQGLIHRDVKPSNIMLALSENGEANVKLLDLGLALFGAASEAVDDFTTVGQLMGTLDYMAPEQADHSHVGATADVYSLGATLFKLLTGKAPFETRENQSPLQKMKALATLTVPSLQDRLPDAPAALSCIVDQLLQRDPNERISSAAKVSEAMQPFCDGHNLTGLAEQAMQRQALEEARIESELPPSVPPSIPSAMLGKSAEPVDSAKPVVTSGTGENNHRWKRWLAGFAAAPLLAFLGVIIWIQTDRGTLKIESVADDVPIEIRQGKQLVESLTLKSGPNEISLRSGRHEVSIEANYDQLQISNNTVEIQRGGQALVRVEHVAEGGGSLFRDARTTLDETPDPLGSPKANSLIFEGRTYAEWKSILNRERSPEELIKGIDALAALSDDSNAAETCKAILKIMDHVSPNSDAKSIEMRLLNTAVRRIKELNPEQLTEVLEGVFETNSLNTCTVIIAELGAREHQQSVVDGRPVFRPVYSQFQNTLLESEAFVDAAFRSWQRWGVGKSRTSLSGMSEAVLIEIINALRDSQKPLTPAMLSFCKQIVEQGSNSGSVIGRYEWHAALFVLLETTDQEDLPDLLWKAMTSLDDSSCSNAWRQLAESPDGIRKMLPKLKADLRLKEHPVLTSLIYKKPGDSPYRGYLDVDQQPQFFRSTLIVELMGLSKTDAISCQQQLSEQFLLHGGVTPTADGIYTFQPAADLICPQLTSPEPAESDADDGVPKATFRHVQALIWAWEEITGEPAKFVQPVFPKLAEFPAELQPIVATYQGKTIAEWAEYDGSDFESWEAEIARYQFLETQRTQDGLPESVQEAQKRIAEHAVLEFCDDSVWFKLVHQLLTDWVIEDEAAVRFDRMLETLNTAQCAQLLTECFVRLNDAALADDETSKGLLTRLASIALGYASDGRSEGYNYSSSQTAVINRLVLELQRLPMRQQHEVLMRVNFWPLPLSQEAQNRVKRLSESDDQLRTLATFAAGRQFQLSETDREQIIDRLIEMLEQPDEGNANWLNAAMSLGVAVSGGVTEQQMRRLVAIAVDEKASECFDVLWNCDIPVYSEESVDNVRLASPIAYENVTKPVVVSQRSLVLQIVSEVLSHQPKRRLVLMFNTGYQAIVDLASSTAEATPSMALPTPPQDASYRFAYVQSIRPSNQSDQAVAAEWAARVLEAAGMMVRE